MTNDQVEKIMDWLDVIEQVHPTKEEVDGLVAVARAALYGSFHHDACPWLKGKECCCSHREVEAALIALVGNGND